ncbi:MAG: P-II family nitrogen regulator [Armatimonadota bacterium]
MKKVEAIIRPECAERVRAALKELSYPGLTISDVKGHGAQKGMRQQWRGKEYVVELLPKVKLEIVAVDDDVPAIVHAIVKNARTGEEGDGKIFVLPIEDAVRVRTGDEGDNAI